MAYAVTDLHCHILPALDDGPETLPEALEMARLLAQEGVHTVVATPHAREVEAAGGREALHQRIEAFRQAVAEAGISLTVVMGAEHFFLPDLIGLVEQGKAISLNGSRYLLVEMDFVHYPPFAEQVVFALRLRGITPVLAHPERQAVLQRQPQRLRRLAELGVLFQITGASLLGGFGGAAQRTAQDMLKEGLVHAIATDAHHAQGPRAPLVRPVMEVVTRWVGQAGAQRLFSANPSAIVHNGEVETPPVPPQRGRLVSLFRRE
ncbi:MAG: phosphotransferase [Dehalococcoidia bacterium]|nr:phosphotransferase [Dehalococcoidia bacterium]MDW8120573.1 CpsB/CapC family capsule biosynthesis tyrosine phosphatase [Chloroflexota bacterium]